MEATQSENQNTSDFCDAHLDQLLQNRKKYIQDIGEIEASMKDNIQKSKGYIKQIERVIQQKRQEISLEDATLLRELEDRKQKIRQAHEEIKNLNELIARTKFQTEATKQNIEQTKRMAEHIVRNKENIRDVYQGIMKMKLDGESDEGMFLPATGMPITFSLTEYNTPEALWSLVEQYYVPSNLLE